MRNVIVLILILTPFLVSAQCVKGNCQNGKGTYKFENGSVYYGQFRDAQLYGTGTMKYASGDKYTGQWIDNKREGGGKLERVNGSIYEGKFVGNKINGKGRLMYKSGDRYVGTFVESVPNGKGKLYFKNGNKYDGEVVKAKMDGKGRMEYKNGDMYSGGWKENKKHGEGFFQWASGKSIEGVWVEGKRDKTAKKPKASELGSVRSSQKESNASAYSSTPQLLKANQQSNGNTFVFRYSDGTTYYGEMNDGQPTGQGKVFYVNGDVYEGGWKNHGPDGYGIMHFTNGLKYATNWIDGTPGKAMNNDVAVIEKQKHLPVKNTEDVKIFALVVGISNYNHMPALRYTDDDAYHFYAFLKSPEGGAVPDEQIMVLIDDAANKKSILTEMQNLFKQADDNDVVLMYYSGHGLNGAFVPHDFDGFNNTIAHSDILTIFGNSNAKHKICIADACHSGSLYASRSMTSALDQYYDSFDESKSGTALLVSSKTEEVSLEYSGLRQGVFSHFLIRGLKGEANYNRDSKVSVSELYSYISRHVKDYTGNYQHPSISGDYDPDMPVAMVR